jgi:hypothetical protein
VASDLRARLKKASAQLRADGHPELSSSVDAILAPGGWSKLRNEAGAPSASNLPLFMPETLREALKEAADDKDVSLAAVVNEGLRAAVEGRWVPPVRVRAARGSVAGQKNVNLNVRVDDVLRADFMEALPELSRKAGGKLSLTSVAVAWLCEELGVNDQAGTEDD